MGTVLLANPDHAFSASSDLMVEYLTWEPEHPLSGGPFSVHGRIRNIGGTQSSDKYTLSVYVDDWWVDGWLVRMTGFQSTVSPRIAPSQAQVWHFGISDYAIFKRGNHQIKAIVSEPNDSKPDNNELVKTLSISPGDYSSDFNIVNYGMCNGIDEDGLPVGITENYSLNDKLAISYFYTDLAHSEWAEEIGQKTGLSFRFYSPNGTLHAESRGYSVLPVKDPGGREITGVALQLFINKDSQALGKEGDPLYDPGYQALNKYLGIWRAEVFNKGHLVFSKRFIIEDTSSRIMSTTLARPEPKTGSTFTTSTEGIGSQDVGSYAIAVGAIAVTAVVCCIALVMRHFGRRPSWTRERADPHTEISITSSCATPTIHPTLQAAHWGLTGRRRP